MNHSIIAKVTVNLLLISLLYSCRGEKYDKKVTSSFFSSKAAVFKGNIDSNISNYPITITSELPDYGSNFTIMNQDSANYFAWRNFIALNWSASTNKRGTPNHNIKASDYGVPGDLNPTVWESYMSLGEVFNNNKDSHNIRLSKPSKKLKFTAKTHSLKKNKAKLLGSKNQVEELLQAQGTWLTDQNGNLVWYEVKMNFTEYDFIHKNNLNDYDGFKKYSDKNQVWLPNGSVELKAAWKVVPIEDVDKVKPYYKLSKAFVPKVIGFQDNNKPIFGDETEQYLALVGLHIITKTTNSSQFVWMTFEHIHNAPTEGEKNDTKISYSFYNKNNKNGKINQPPVVNKDSLNKPVQVMRIKSNTITDEINELNSQVHKIIRGVNPNSVWQYYRLVNVQWPQSNVDDSFNNKNTPLDEGGITPETISNVTMETYAQNRHCMDCHRDGNVKIEGKKIPTSYSFVFKALEK